MRTENYLIAMFTIDYSPGEVSLIGTLWRCPCQRDRDYNNFSFFGTK